jgi:hypothetical protein
MSVAIRARSPRWKAWKASIALVALMAAACSAPPDESVGTTGTAATAFANDRPAYDYFLAKGLTSFQAAGIVGNLDQESGVDPTAVQAGGPGRGIAQWSAGGRWDTDAGDNLVAYAATQGQPTSSLNVQLDFIWFELESFSSYGLAKLRATTNVHDATVAFETDFEGCGACDEAARVTYAEDVLKAYGGDVPPSDGGANHDAPPSADAPAHEAAASDGAVSASDGGSGPDALADPADAATHHDAPTTGIANAPPDTEGVSTGCSTAVAPTGGAGGLWMLAAWSIVVLRRRARSRVVRRA